MPAPLTAHGIGCQIALCVAQTQALHRMRRCDSPQRTESAVIRTGTRARRSPAAKGLVGWTKIALVGLLMLSTGGCLLFWNKNAQLRNSLDAQIKDNRLREQVIAQLMECIIDE